MVQNLSHAVTDIFESLASDWIGRKRFFAKKPYRIGAGAHCPFILEFLLPWPGSLWYDYMEC